ncbi:MAG: XamI family restriction endonuclease [Planctomycetes bacterium]|nr:XamI family restriction endonuclease [Planctomycetota bacterium]
MPIHADKPHLWKADLERSIDFYNDWFIRFAPETYRTQRGLTTAAVLNIFGKTDNLTRIVPAVLHTSPGLLPILRMVTAPPLARDRLMGLAHVSKSFIDTLEGKQNIQPRLPKRMPEQEIQENLHKLCDVLAELIDGDLIPWVASGEKPSKQELDRAATVVADRMCGASSDPIIRNAQERRQLATLKRWLRKNGYKQINSTEAKDPHAMPPGTFTFRLSLAAGSQGSCVKIPIDCVVKPLGAQTTGLPVLIEAKSAGDATNTNKRRKEEAQKFRQLKERYGDAVNFLLYLCGYFEPGYLGYEAAEGIDWVWEHRTDDFALLLVAEIGEKTRAMRESPGSYIAADNQAQEDHRADAQNLADARKSAEERNRLGQFSTPFPVASQIIARALNALPPESSIAFLEPALGSGVFFSALLRNTRPGRIAHATGCEIDPAYGDIARAIWASYGLHVLTCDFIGFTSDRGNFGNFSLLCTNPPYVRHHHLQPDQKAILQSLVVQRLGLQASGLSGLYVYFVLLADALLADAAVASWLLPAEFLYVNYGRVLRDYFTSRVTLLSIHHFDPDDVQFDDALVSSCIVTYRKAPASGGSTCEMSYGGTYDDPQHKRTVPISELRSLNKWTMPHFGGDASLSDTLRLKDLFTVRRGIATGANDFFIIDRETAVKYNIPKAFLRPVLPSPRFVRGPVIESNGDGLPKVPGFHYLLDCTIPPDQVMERHPGLWAYLQEGLARGISQGYLCAQREVWYFQERREPSPFLASYMGRAKTDRECPIRFFVNFSSAIVTNVFLNLYPNPELDRCLHGNRDRMLELGQALNSVPSECVLQAGRAYGGGLHKIEPKELLEVRLASVPAWLKGALKKQLILIY